MTLKEEYQNKIDKMFNDCEVFWAFNEKQLREGIAKHNISENNRMISMGMGGYMPSKHKDKYIKDADDIEDWYKAQLKEPRKNKAELEKVILYELDNYECFYTGDINKACEVLPTISRKEVLEVYRKHRGSRD